MKLEWVIGNAKIQLALVISELCILRICGLPFDTARLVIGFVKIKHKYQYSSPSLFNSRSSLVRNP